MADKQVKVAVLEGDFDALSKLGLPFSVRFQLQSAGLKLSKALWTAKTSNTGFSISLFWPLQKTHMASASQSQSLRRRKREDPGRNTRLLHMSNQYKMM